MFTELRQNKIKSLVVDLRDNTGGTDPYAVYLTSYLFDSTFQFGDRTEVTEAIAKEIKGTYRLFYKKPIKQDSIWLWQDGKVKDLNSFTKVKAAKNNFKGNTYVLINSFCMSSCADVTAVLSQNKRATFIGEETGGGYQGNNSGMLPNTTVKPFDFVLTVPLQEYYLAVDPKVNFGRGTMPDYPVYPSTDDIIKGNDTQLDFTISLIKRK